MHFLHQGQIGGGGGSKEPESIYPGQSFSCLVSEYSCMSGSI